MTDRLDTLEQVRLGFNAAAEAMNAGGAALTADGGTDLIPLITDFNLAAIALNKAGMELKKQIGNAKGKAHVRVAFAAITLPGAGVTTPAPKVWTGRVVERSSIVDVFDEQVRQPS